MAAAVLALLGALPVAAQEGCPAPLRELVEAPREAFGESRQAATEMLGLPSRVDLEVTEDRHAIGDGSFLPVVHYRLKYSQLELQYWQSAVGGREGLEEVELRGSEQRLRLPFTADADLSEVREAVGRPTDTGRYFLYYECHHTLGADELRFDFSPRTGELLRTEWVYFWD